MTKRAMRKIILPLFLFLASCQSTDPFARFDKLEPKAIYGDYEIYDLIEQNKLACAEAIEYLDTDDAYQYYFNCLKSDQIFFVSDEEIIKVKHFYAAGLISLKDLYDRDIVDRMEK